MSKWPIDPRLYALIQQIEEPLTEAEEVLLCQRAEAVSDTGLIMELNPYQGRTTAILALASPGKDRQLYCIDQWNHIYMQLWLDNMAKLGIGGTVLPLRGEPLDMLRVMGPHLAARSVELVVLHGRQGLTELLAVYATALSFLQPGKTILLHKTADSAGYWNQFWEIAAKLLRGAGSCGTLYYGVKP